MQDFHPVFYPSTGTSTSAFNLGAGGPARTAIIPDQSTNAGHTMGPTGLSQPQSVIPSPTGYPSDYSSNDTSSSNPSNINGNNATVEAPSSVSTTSIASNQEPQLPPQYGTSTVRQPRDWSGNPAFPKSAAPDEGHQIFPVVLHRVLTELERVSQGTEIATFSADGKSFFITSQSLFEEQILPIFFPKMKNFASFQRQLNLYNFKRSNRDAGKDRGSYRHELFHRDHPLSAHGMKRTRLKGNTRRNPSSTRM